VDQAQIHLSALAPDLAAGLLAGCSHLDPRGTTTERDIEAMTRGGQCYAATAPQGQCVYVVKIANGVAWVDAIKGTGPVDWTFAASKIIEAQAKGLRAVAFQTARPGLVRRMKREGYRVTGWVMRKDLQP
jgi:hypothetical protein